MLRRIGRTLKKYAKKFVTKFKKIKDKFKKKFKKIKSKKVKKNKKHVKSDQPDQVVVASPKTMSYVMKFVTVVAVASGVFFVTWPFTGPFAPVAEPLGYALLATAGIELGT
jgi:hypothetical protein